MAGLAFAGEILSVSFFLLFFSLGAVVALAMAFAGLTLPAQAIGFIVASILSMAVLRPALLNRLALRGGERYTGHRGIMGESAVVTEPIEAGGKGAIRIGSGEFWTARALYHEGEIERGAKVRVLDTDGLTALVEPMESRGGEL
ncbi:MAG: Putative activity regulator of membrane protease YbbK [uncultured Rubrobacteraceae bacterium]|uniref:Activity regulator of membrane protease YbbK n=1 Tax=uncultured Rubrobacteraceae bacterium TaxID=349277 RepID=A0A6J4NWG5_9ACTN|nr:MAG: Putative activity regulator of membrane protease YbbK [uncultured Rubrobacteraceae bacterium]